MRFAAAIDLFIADKRREGRINSQHTEDAYRAKLEAHADDVGQADPVDVTRADVKTTLGRWAQPNSQRQAHSVLASFYAWCMEEGLRETNPAQQVSRAKARKATVYRLTRDEVLALIAAAAGERRDRWVVGLGAMMGLRNQELRGVQGRHFQREGALWISEDIGKGSKERWLPIVEDFAEIAQEIRLLVAPDAFVLPGRRYVDPPHNTHMQEMPDTRLSASALYKQVGRIGQRAGIAAPITPHTLRHAYGDHVAKYAGLRAAQALLGHADVNTTAEVYTDRVSLDELTASVRGFTYQRGAAVPVENTRG